MHHSTSPEILPVAGMRRHCAIGRRESRKDLRDV